MIAVRLLALVTLASLPLGLTTGCDTGGSYRTTQETGAERSPSLESDAEDTVRRMKETEPGLKVYFDTAAGYAVFPEIAKGGLILGGSHGDGVLYDGGAATHYATVTAGTIGAQIGGQVFSEIIFFQTRSELATFRSGGFELDANASAVAARRGASSAADYVKGVAVFVSGERGLMAEASVGGQKFDVRRVH